MLQKILREFQQISSGYGVPFVATPDDKLEIIVKSITLKEGEVFVDIGCGDGRVLEAIAKNSPKVRCIGYESSKYPYKEALRRQQNSQYNFEIYNEDIFKTTLENATSIYIYMVPYMIQRVVKKIQEECTPGTKIYIQSHKIKNWIPERIVSLSEKNNLYVYTL